MTHNTNRLTNPIIQHPNLHFPIQPPPNYQIRDGFHAKATNKYYFLAKEAEKYNPTIKEAAYGKISMNQLKLNLTPPPKIMQQAPIGYNFRRNLYRKKKK